MKKAFISSLIMTLIVANISSVQAATTDNNVTTSTENASTATTDNTIKVSLDNIRDIVIENNLDIKNSYNSNKIAVQEYHDARDAYDSAKTDYDVLSSKDTIVSTYNAVKATYDEGNDSIKASLKPTYDAAKDAYDKKNIYDNADTTLTTKREAYKTAQTTYDQKVETTVSSAQNAYIAYLNDLSNVKLQEDTVKNNEKAVQVYKLQYESGFISKNDYIDKLQKNTAVNDSNASKDTEELDRTKLCNLLGISPAENITFDTDINEDFQIISKIKYEDDLKQMLDNNIAIKDQNNAISDLEDQKSDYEDKDESDIYNYEIENENNKLQQLLNTNETAFKDQYNALMKSYNVIKSSYDVILQEQKEYQDAQTQYDYGFVSKNEVDTAKLAFDKDNATFNASKNKLYVDYLRYIQMKEGY